MASEAIGKQLVRIASALERIADVLDGKRVETSQDPGTEEISDPPTEDTSDQSEPTRPSERKRNRRTTPLPLPPLEEEEEWHSEVAPSPAPQIFGRPTMPSEEFERFGSQKTESDTTTKRFGFRLPSLSDQHKTKG